MEGGKEGSHNIADGGGAFRIDITYFDLLADGIRVFMTDRDEQPFFSSRSAFFESCDVGV